MESSTATHPQGPYSVPQPVPPSTLRARRRGEVLGHMLWIADAVAGVAAPLLAFLILKPGAHVTLAIGLALLNAVLWTLAAFSVGLYRGDQLATWASAIPEVSRIFVALMLVSWPLFGIAAGLGIDSPAIFALTTVLLMSLLDTAARAFVRARLHRARDLAQRTLVLGSGVVAGQLTKKLRNNDQYGLVPMGIVDDEVHHVGDTGLPWLGKFDELDRILEKERVDRVIIAFSRASHEELLDAIRVCRDAGVAIDVVPRLFEFLDGAGALDQVGGLPLLSMGPAHLTRVAMISKRTLDIVGSSLALVVLSPLLLAIAAAIKLESPGPVFFRQQRAGRGNKGFRLFKYRSMYVDAEERKAELAERNEAGDGVMFKIRDDPRVTRVGQFLRRTSLDELPQLINVLKGEMSLVGPRPLIFKEAAALEEHWHMRRLELRPGLTGPWQIYGRSQSPFQEMVRFDYQYVAGWSLARDVEILLATVPAVISGRGAY